MMLDIFATIKYWENHEKSSKIFQKFKEMVPRRRSETNLGNKYVLQMRSGYFLVAFWATLLILDAILAPARFLRVSPNRVFWHRFK